jgi:hypothetical protein
MRHREQGFFDECKSLAEFEDSVEFGGRAADLATAPSSLLALAGLTDSKRRGFLN